MVAALILLLGIFSGAETWLLKPPLGLDLFMFIPETNLLSKDKVALGRKLFFDKRLSADNTVSCASCHDPKRAFTDGRAVAIGIGGAKGTRNSPALINRGYGSVFFWDGRAPSLERQVLEPILNPKELGLSTAVLEQRTGLKSDVVVAALASYVRTIRSGDSRFDRYSAGRSGALKVLEKKGLELFRGRGRCSICHIGPSLTDERFHNTGIAWTNGQMVDDGRHAVSSNERDLGAFKTPTLREIARTAPYMHDGSIPTLEDVLDFYSNGGRNNPHLDAEIRPLNLSNEEKHAIIAFLHTLNGSVEEGPP
jgi:cytochrome c peroxidase